MKLKVLIYLFFLFISINDVKGSLLIEKAYFNINGFNTFPWGTSIQKIKKFIEINIGSFNIVEDTIEEPGVRVLIKKCTTQEKYRCSLSISFIKNRLYKWGFYCFVKNNFKENLKKIIQRRFEHKFNFKKNYQIIHNGKLIINKNKTTFLMRDAQIDKFESILFYTLESAAQKKNVISNNSKWFTERKKILVKEKKQREEETKGLDY